MDAPTFFTKGVARGTLSHAYCLWGYGSEAARHGAAVAVARLFETEPFVDCLIIRPHGESVGIGDIREATRFLWQSPARSARKTVIVSDAGTMTHEAQNALLATLEEPPAHGLLILVVRDPALLLPALRSRMQSVHIPSAAGSESLDAAAVDLARQFIAFDPRARKDMLKAMVEAEDVPAFDRFAAAMMAELDRDPRRNWRPLKELSHRIRMMAEHPTNRRLQWEAVSSYL